MTITDWLAPAVFPGGLLILTVTCLWLSVALFRRGRDAEGAIVFVAFVALAIVVWVLYRFFAGG